MSKLLNRPWWAGVRLGVLAAGLAAPAALNACTLWGAAGADAGGGTVIAKNRDWKPDHVQVLELRRSKTDYAYFGLYAVGNDAEGIKQGVNEKGLSVVTATAGSVPKATREALPGRGGLMTTLLRRYATCDQILADKQELLSGRKPSFLLISDRKQLLVLEVGLGGRYAIKVVDSGVAAHCNHFLEDSLADCNLRASESSTTRVARIAELLRAAPRPLDTAAFAAMSRDHAGGANNSLWRTGSGGATLSSWIVENPPRGPSKLRVVIANPGRPEQTNVFVLDRKFWADTRFENRVAAEKARRVAEAARKAGR
jgi:isopenicillin-N N-acyltransferase like protein